MDLSAGQAGSGSVAEGPFSGFLHSPGVICIWGFGVSCRDLKKRRQEPVLGGAGATRCPSRCGGCSTSAGVLSERVEPSPLPLWPSLVQVWAPEAARFCLSRQHLALGGCWPECPRGGAQEIARVPKGTLGDAEEWSGTQIHQLHATYGQLVLLSPAPEVDQGQ